MIPPEVMAKIVKRFHWRLALADMSRNLIETEYDEHFFAVSAHGPYPRDTQILSIRSIAKILGRSLPAAQYHLEEHKELVLLDGVCSVCQRASGELERGPGGAEWLLKLINLGERRSSSSPTATMPPITTLHMTPRTLLFFCEIVSRIFPS